MLEPRKTSSLKPSNELGRIRISHERHLVESCHWVKDDDEKACVPDKKKPAASGTKITVKPLGASGKVDANDKRAKQILEFDNVAGRQSKTALLAPGVWELTWVDGGAAKDRFRVEPGDTFHIGLESFKGACEAEGDSCKLLKSKALKSIEIPVDRVLE
jgi:hypothetical protein